MDFDGPKICPGCNKPTYPQERPVGALKATWHPGCLKCGVCATVLTVRSLESYQNKPYCRAHRPNPAASQTDKRLDYEVATQAPKAAKKEQGVDKTDVLSFGVKKTAPPSGTVHGYVPASAGPHTTARRTQGVNKAERMTFAPNSIAPINPTSERTVYTGGSIETENDHHHNSYNNNYQDNSYQQEDNNNSYYDQNNDNNNYQQDQQQQDYSYDDQQQQQGQEGAYDDQQQYYEDQQGYYDENGEYHYYEQQQGGEQQSYDYSYDHQQQEQSADGW